MVGGNNYLIQAQQAKDRFLTYDQERLIKKLKLNADEKYLYTKLLNKEYRIERTTGDLTRREGDSWLDANTFEEVMTLMDLVCDCREDRFVTGRWKNMGDFGLMFHRNLLEGTADPWAERLQADPEGFRRACRALGGRELKLGDISYAIELFDGLCIVLQLWFGDEEFPANLRILWDENAKMYIRYETMYFAKGLLFDRLEALMK